MGFIGRMNKYIDETMPWVLAKSEEAHDKARLQSVCITWQKHCVSLLF